MKKLECVVAFFCISRERGSGLKKINLSPRGVVCEGCAEKSAVWTYILIPVRAGSAPPELCNPYTL